MANKSISKARRARQKKHRPFVVWFTGLSGSGKSTLANALEEKLLEFSCHAYLLDGDALREGLNRDLGFSEDHRRENIRRAGEVAALFVDAGVIVLATFISPFRDDRRQVRELLQPEEFVEIHVSTSLDVCEMRDPKGLYKKARSGELRNFTGIDSAYEEPVSPELVLDTSALSVQASVEAILSFLKLRGLLGDEFL